jgi:hypothetical protein
MEDRRQLAREFLNNIEMYLGSLTDSKTNQLRQDLAAKDTHSALQSTVVYLTSSPLQ